MPLAMYDAMLQRGLAPRRVARDDYFPEPLYCISRARRTSHDAFRECALAPQQAFDDIMMMTHRRLSMMMQAFWRGMK